MIFQIYGMGCAKCELLTSNVRKAVAELGIEAEIVKVEDFEMLIRKGITTTPGLVIDGEIRSMGRVPSVEEIKEMIGLDGKEESRKTISEAQVDANTETPKCGCSNKEAMIFACSGASNVGQLSNEAAKSLSAQGLGKFSCLAGVGSHGGGFISSAKRANRIICLDGCATKCASKTLTHAGVEPSIQLVITDLGINKEHGRLDPTPAELDKVVKLVQRQL